MRSIALMGMAMCYDIVQMPKTLALRRRWRGMPAGEAELIKDTYWGRNSLRCPGREHGLSARRYARLRPAPGKGFHPLHPTFDPCSVKKSVRTDLTVRANLNHGRRRFSCISLAIEACGSDEIYHLMVSALAYSARAAIIPEQNANIRLNPPQSPSTSSTSPAAYRPLCSVDAIVSGIKYLTSAPPRVTCA